MNIYAVYKKIKNKILEKKHEINARELFALNRTFYSIDKRILFASRYNES